MNKKNTIVLSLILGVAMNQAFGEGADKKTVVENKDTKTLPKENLEKADAKLKKLQEEKKVHEVDLIKTKAELEKKGLDHDQIEKNKEVVDKIEAGKKIDANIEVATKERDAAWEKAHTIKAAALKWATGIVLGGFLIERFSLTGNMAKFAKYSSAATVTGLCAFALYKGYNYLFTEEINDSEEEF